MKNGRLSIVYNDWSKEAVEECLAAILEFAGAFSDREYANNESGTPQAIIDAEFVPAACKLFTLFFGRQPNAAELHLMMTH